MRKCDVCGVETRATLNTISSTGWIKEDGERGRRVHVTSVDGVHDMCDKCMKAIDEHRTAASECTQVVVDALRLHVVKAAIQAIRTAKAEGGTDGV